MGDSTAVPLLLNGEPGSAVECDPGQLVAQFYTMHAASLHGYLLLTGCSPADADELLQEAFLRLFRCLRDGERVLKPKAWLIRVLQNLRTDMMRRDRGLKMLIGSAVAENQPLWPCPHLNPEEAVIGRQRLERLHAAMNGLSERQSQYLLLRSEGLTLREIAEVHGVAVQSVAETCARAIERLGKLTHE